MWQSIAAILVPIALAVVGFLGSGGTRLSKKISHHADLLPKLTGAPEASAAMQILLAKEVRWLDDSETARRDRKINWTYAFRALTTLMIFGSATVGLVLYALGMGESEGIIHRSLASAVAGGVATLGGFTFGSAVSKLFLPADQTPPPLLALFIDALLERRKQKKIRARAAREDSKRSG